MAKQSILLGTLPNDGTGDPIRTAFTKINANFTELYDRTVDLGSFKISSYSLGTLGADENSWGLSPISIDPGGESYSGIWIPAVAAQTEGASLDIYNNAQGAGPIQLSVHSGLWQFNNNGTLTVPTLTVNLHNGGDQQGQVLQFGGNQQVIITGPTPAESASAQRLIIQGQKATGTGEGGDVYVWGGDAQIDGGDIKIYAGDADSSTEGYGGYINLQSGYGHNTGGQLNINSGNSEIQGGHLNLYAGSGQGGGTGLGGNLNLYAGGGSQGHGVINLNTTGNQWQFNADGGLKFPDNTIQTTAYQEVDENIWVQEISNTNTGNGEYIQGCLSVNYDSNGDIIGLFLNRDTVDNSSYTTIAKYNSTGGNPVWQTRFVVDDVASYQTDGWGIALDSDNNVYVCGRYYDNTTYPKTFVTQISNLGIPQWTKIYDFGHESTSYVIDVTSDNKLAIVGSAFNDDGGYINTLKLEPTDGSIIWAKKLDGVGNDEAYGMGVGPSGEIVAVGNIEIYDSGNLVERRMIVTKYNSDGTQDWQKSVLVDTGYRSEGADADIDSDGNVYVVGSYFSDKPDNNDVSSIVIIKFNSSGDSQWLRKVSGPCEDYSACIVVGPDNKLYISATTGNGGTSDYSVVIAKYQTDGTVEWQRTIDNLSTWTFSGNWFWSYGGGSNLDVKDGYVLFGGGIANPFYNYQTSARGLMVQVPTTGNTFTIGNYVYSASNLSGLLTSAQNISDAGRDHIDITGDIIVNSNTVSVDYGILTQAKYSLNSAAVTTVTVDAGGDNNSVSLNASATINKLSIYRANNNVSNSSMYTLADGVEGQIMYLVPVSAGQEYITMRFDHARYKPYGSDSIAQSQNVDWWLPFKGSSQYADNAIVTLIFTDGYWNLPHAIFD